VLALCDGRPPSFLALPTADRARGISADVGAGERPGHAARNGLLEIWCFAYAAAIRVRMFTY